MAELLDQEVEIDGYMMGPDRDIFVSKLDVGTATTRDQDADNPVGDTRLFGRDQLTPPIWNLDLVVDTWTDADARKAIADLARKWRPPAIRTKPGATSVLRYRVAGQTRRVYGRGRDFAPDVNNLHDGATTITAAFALADCLHYEDDARTLPLGLVPPPTGGFFAPFTTPVYTVSTGAAQGVIEDVGGDTNAPFTATIKGPVSDPAVEGDGWRLAWNGTLAYDQTLVIDTRLNTATVNGANVAGQLSRRSRFANARLRPGADFITFTGVDPTGTATCTITWRPAYHSF